MKVLKECLKLNDGKKDFKMIPSEGGCLRHMLQTDATCRK